MYTAPFIGPCSATAATYCSCDGCCEMYAVEGEAERAAEAANERALYGPTEAMLADFEVEREREASDLGLAFLDASREASWEWEAC